MSYVKSFLIVKHSDNGVLIFKNTNNKDN
jgi:hypothetical protein